MSRLRAPGAVGPRAIRPPSGLVRPPLTAAVPPGTNRPLLPSQPRPPTNQPGPNRLPPNSHPSSSQFQLGDHVLVGGEKNGKIAFIGPTQFAQGVWAGIILDTPDGKNDGSVKGVAYFNCPPNYGLFAKLDKLTPLPQQPRPTHSQSAEREEVEFNIGDRVITDGGKRGTVSFVGPTQFAKGVWVGVSLDTSEGKNNGTVGGVQYFTCPPNHGVFTRPIKLTLETTVTPTNQPSRSSGGVTPADPSELKKKAESLKEGDRVIVNNSKEGTLRFIGPTHFAKGIWVGVELDDAQGKNDGAVSGKRYFQCEPAHGLFAPLPKVERVGTAGHQRSSLRGISGSPVSSVSSLSSMGRLRQIQQQQHLPLEPEPASPARSDTSTNDFSHIMFEKNHQIATLKSSLEQSENDKVKLSEETTELRRKVEDLQFLLEEQNIISGDQLEQVSAREQNELQQVKNLLTEERTKREKLEEELKSSLAELEMAKSAAPPPTDNSAIFEEKNKEIERLEREKEQLQLEVNNTKLSLTSVEGDFKSTETAAKDLQSELDTTKQQLQETLDLCAQQETLLEEKVNEIETISEEKRQIVHDLDRVTGEKQSLLSSTEQLINERDNALSQCNRLMAESSSASSEQGYLAQQNNDLMTERDQLKQELRETKSLLEKVIQEKEDALYDLSDLKTQGREVQGQSHEIQLKYETLQKEHYTAADDLDKVRRESAALSEEIEQLKLTSQQKLEMSEAVTSDLKARLSKVTQERDISLQEAQAAADKLEEVKRKRNELIDSSREYQRVINELQDQLEDVTQRYNTLVTEGDHQSGDVQAQLEETEERLEQKMRELEESKERVASLEEEMVVLSSNTSDDPRLAVLEKEKLRLEGLVDQLNSSKGGGGGGEQDPQIILELKEENRTLQASLQDKDQEINFLNSVIAELQLKVESLESLNGLGEQATMLGYTSEDDILDSQLPPPRVFCDICDQFDLHDTADCPMQAAAIDIDASPPHSMHHALRAQERPYCENCEVFGHWTDECEYEETY